MTKQFFELELPWFVLATQLATDRNRDLLEDMCPPQPSSSRLPVRKGDWRIISVPRGLWVLQERQARSPGEHRTSPGWRNRSRHLPYAEALARLQAQQPQWTIE